MLEMTFRNNRDSAGSAGSRYTFSDSSMIDLVRGLNGATFDPFPGADEAFVSDTDSEDEDQEGLIPVPSHGVSSVHSRRRLSTNVGGLRSRLSNQNLVGFFGSQRGRDDDSKAKADAKRNRLSTRGRPELIEERPLKISESSSSPKPRRDTPEHTNSAEPGESTDTLQVIEDIRVPAKPETLEVPTLPDEKPKPRKPTRKPPTNKTPEYWGQGNEKVQDSTIKAQTKDKRGLRKEKKALDSPTEKYKSRNAALKSLDPSKKEALDCPLIPTKTELEGNSKDAHSGTTWMRKSASSLFPSLTRDGANTLPPFQRWSNLLGSHSSHVHEDSSVFLPRANEDCNTIFGGDLLQHDGIEPRTSSPECTENGKRMYWRKLISGRISWGRKSSKVKEESFCTSAPVSMSLKKLGMDGEKSLRPGLRCGKREAKAEAKSALNGNKCRDLSESRNGKRTASATATTNRNFAIVGVAEPRKTRASDTKAKSGSLAEAKAKLPGTKSSHKSGSKSSEAKAKRKTSKHKKPESASKP